MDQAYTGDGNVRGFHGLKSERTLTLSQEEVNEEKVGGNWVLNVILNTPFFVPDALLGTLPEPAIFGPQGAPIAGGRHIVDYRRHIDIRPPLPATDDIDLFHRMYPEQRAVARRFVTAMTFTFGDQNAPLGIIDGAVKGTTNIHPGADGLGYDRGPKNESGSPTAPTTPATPSA